MKTLLSTLVIIPRHPRMSLALLALIIMLIGVVIGMIIQSLKKP